MFHQIIPATNANILGKKKIGTMILQAMRYQTRCTLTGNCHLTKRVYSTEAKYDLGKSMTICHQPTTCTTLQNLSGVDYSMKIRKMSYQHVPWSSDSFNMMNGNHQMNLPYVVGKPYIVGTYGSQANKSINYQAANMSKPCLVTLQKPFIEKLNQNFLCISLFFTISGPIVGFISTILKKTNIEELDAKLLLIKFASKAAEFLISMVS